MSSFRLADVAPRLARARDQLVAEREMAWVRKRERIAEARARKRARRESPAVVFCGKVRYGSRAEAVAGRAQSRAPVRLYSYECGVCGGWHLSKHQHPRWAKAGEAA